MRLSKIYVNSTIYLVAYLVGNDRLLVFLDKVFSRYEYAEEHAKKEVKNFCPEILYVVKISPTGMTIVSKVTVVPQPTAVVEKLNAAITFE